MISVLVVKVDDLLNELSSLNAVINNYEENYKAIFKELDNSKSFWNDGYAKSFYNDEIIENYQNKEHNSNIRSLEKIYKYIIEKYQEIGNKIEIELSYRDNILENFNKRISDIRDIINQYKGIDTYYCPKERNVIENQIKDLRATITTIRQSKEEYKNLFDKVETIEKNIRERLAKIEVYPIKELKEDKYFNLEGEA